MKVKVILLIGIILASIMLLKIAMIDQQSSIDYRDEMIQFVIRLHELSNDEGDFIIMPQNGVELIEDSKYLDVIDGLSQEDLSFGYEQDYEKTPDQVTAYLNAYLKILINQNKPVFITDYFRQDQISSSQSINEELGYVSFQADRLLQDIPPVIYNENDQDILSLSDVRNYLYLLEPSKYSSKDEYIKAMKSTNYDLLVIDYAFEDQVLTPEDVNELKIKANGHKRLVLAYLSIGEVESYRPYWDDTWLINPPKWLDHENINWQDNYKVKYWYEAWQVIIIGYLHDIMNQTFDGVFLDLVDAYDYYE